MSFIEGLVSGAAGGLLGLAGSASTNAANKEINEQNIAYQRETNQKNEQLMRESWSRDDTAVQRRTKDLVQAGMSPLLAAGAAASNSGPVSMSAPQSKQVVQKSGLEGAISGIYQGIMTQMSYMDMMARQQQLLINQNQYELNSRMTTANEQIASANAGEINSKIKNLELDAQMKKIGIKYEDRIKMLQLLQQQQSYSDAQYNRSMSEKYGLRLNESGNTITKTAQQLTEAIKNL